MIEFKLPSLGADMDEGTLLEWKVKPGDQIRKGQVVAVVDTAKTAVDVECWQEGTVGLLLVQPQEKIPVGSVLALLLEAGETPADAKKYKREKRVEPEPVSPGAEQAAIGTSPQELATVAAGQHRVSPAARRRAQELGVDVDTIRGTGAQGAVTLEDVERRVAPGAAPKDRQAEMRQAIAAAMSRSKREIPHYYLSESIPMARALDWLARANVDRAMTERLLPAVLLLKAVSLVLRKYPEFNGFWRDGAYHPAERVNPGVAISLRQGGLMAPALLDADQKDLTTLMRELTDLVKRTRSGSLKSSELSEATMTITNLGDQGVESVFGVIYPPQVALVGFGQIATRPWVEAGQIQVQPMVTASLSADHRVSDGHRGALFLAGLRERLQQPEGLEPSAEGKPS